jgi:defect-in-organelle-trafficking protein DotA
MKVLEDMSDLSGKSVDEMSGEIRYSVSQYVNSLTNSVQNFIQLIRPTLGLVKEGKNQRIIKKLEEQQKQGWIMAGALYKKLAAVQRTENKNIDSVWEVKASGPKLGDKLSENNTNDDFAKLNGETRNIMKKITKGYEGFKNAAIQQVLERVQEATEAGKQGEKKVDGVSLNLLKSAKNGPPKPVEEQGASSGNFESMGGGVLVAITTATPILIAVGAALVTSFFYGNIVGGIGSIIFPPAALSVIFLVIPWIIHAIVADIMNTMQAASDPILAAQTLGLNLLGVTYWIWAGITLFSMLIALAAFLFQSVLPFGGIMEIFTMWLTPIVSVLLTSMAVPGMLLGIYVPLMPFIIYFFAGVGWIIAVLEAMIAAPLVALGVTHPEGHDFLGQSEQAMYLLLNVFLRPILMVIGLVAGMVISRIAFTFLNEGFYQILADTGLIHPINSLFTGGLQMLGILFVYTSTLISMLNLSYSTIHQVPDRIMRWLGRSEEQSQSAQYAQTVQSTTTSAAGQVGGAMKTKGPWESAQIGQYASQGQGPQSEGDSGGTAQGSGGSQGGGGTQGGGGAPPAT